MAVSDWNTNPALNTTIEGEDIGEGCEPAGFNDWGRKICAAIKSWYNSSYGIGINVTAQASGGAAPSSPVEGHLWIEW